jgi:hypothetical protein
MPIALIVGGSDNAFSDFERARILCADAPFEIFIINDMFAEFPHAAEYGVTIHHAKIPGWLAKRAANGYPVLGQIWAHRSGEYITHHTLDWCASTGFFAVKIALENDFDRIILCGVPLSPEQNHFIRHKFWSTCKTFRSRLDKHKTEIAPYVRSLSGGWTEQQFSKPDVAWLTT